jgi:hypothetical protein
MTMMIRGPLNVGGVEDEPVVGKAEADDPVLRPLGFGPATPVLLGEEQLASSSPVATVDTKTRLSITKSSSPAAGAASVAPR